MQTVYINGRFLTQPMTGINRFAYEICIELSKVQDITIVTPLGEINPAYDISGLKTIQYGKLQSHLWEQCSLLRFLSKKENPILLCLSGVGPLIYRNKLTTIHDISFLTNKNWFSRSYYYLYRFLTPLQIRTSKYIITVSNFSKKEIINYFRVNPKKIRVVCNAINNSFKDYGLKKEKNSVLTVCSLDPRKNIKAILSAIKLDKEGRFNFKIIGGGNKVFGSLGFDSADFDETTFIGRVSDEELIRQYNKHEIFVSASFYEGFGIPPLEALACGCKLLLSDIPVYHEIFEDAAVYFNPNDSHDLLRGLEKLSNAERYSDPNKILSKFSWVNSAMKVKEIIEGM